MTVTIAIPRSQLYQLQEQLDTVTHWVRNHGALRPSELVRLYTTLSANIDGTTAYIITTALADKKRVKLVAA